MKNNKTVIAEASDFSDLIDLISSGGDALIDRIVNKPSYMGTNIARATSNLILTFPVIVDDSVPIKTARLLTKAIERKAVSMLQILFSAIMVTNNRDAFDFVRKIHTNLSSDDIDEIMQRLNSGYYREDVQISNDAINMINRENVLMESCPQYSKVSKPSLNSIYDVVLEYNMEVDEKEYKEAIKSLEGRKKYFKKNGKYYRNMDDPTYGSSTNVVDLLKKYQNKMQNLQKKGKKKSKVTKKKEREVTHSYNRNLGPVPHPEVLNSEVKKANELQPTLMVVRFRGPESDNDTIYSAVIGVKAKLQYVTMKDMIDRLSSKNKDRHGLVDFIRATTKEIAFFKDFIFAIDKAKLDAISKRGTSSPIWKVLERRALRSRLGKFIGNNSASAISTLVISEEASSILKKDYNLDVFNPKDILEIMDAYNIMAFFVADDVNEVCNCLYDDGSRTFEKYSYSALSKEEHDELKRVITLLAKGK